MMKIRNPLMGALFMTLAMLCFGIGNAIVKGKSAIVSTNDMLLLRGICGLILVLGFVSLKRDYSLLRPANFSWHLIRGTTGYLGLFCLFYSFELLPLADATLFTFASVIFISVLSIFLLKEKLTKPQVLAIFVGVVGIIIVSNPSGHVTLWGVFIALLSSICESIVMIYGKKLSDANKVTTTVFWHTFITMVIAAIIWTFGEKADLFVFEKVWPVAVIAVMGIVGQVCIVTAYSCAAASTVAPFLYTLMIWGFLFGFFFWGEIPQANVFLGTPLILSSGLYMIHHENKMRKKHLQETLL